MSHDLSRWIEQAEARRFGEEVAFERGVRLAEGQYFDLGNRIVGIGRDFLSAVGSHAIALVRHKPDREAA